MPLKSPPGTRYPSELTKEEVIQIFAARAGGAQVRDIAKKFRITPSSCTRVLNREVQADVIIPAAFASKVNELRTKQAPKGKPRKPRPRVSRRSTSRQARLMKALADYVLATEEMRAAQQRVRTLAEKLIALGFHKTTLEQITTDIASTK